MGNGDGGITGYYAARGIGTKESIYYRCKQH